MPGRDRSICRQSVPGNWNTCVIRQLHRHKSAGKLYIQNPYLVACMVVFDTCWPDAQQGKGKTASLEHFRKAAFSVWCHRMKRKKCTDSVKRNSEHYTTVTDLSAQQNCTIWLEMGLDGFISCFSFPMLAKELPHCSYSASIYRSCTI
jgi:hypothetical protein